MEELGYIFTFLAGATLGLLGGGGSILTVPILVYCFSIPAILSTSYSLFIVGVSALVGAFGAYRKGNLQLGIVFLFFIPSFVGIYLARSVLLSMIPEHIAIVGSKDNLVLIVFASLMVWASYSMLFKKPEQVSGYSQKGGFFKAMFALRAFFVGLVTGFVGAGGGFLIVPALVFFAGLNMKAAVGTSLAIIVMNTCIAFLIDLAHTQIDWLFLLTLTGLCVLGIFVGQYVGKFIPDRKLKPIFGGFILVLGSFIFLKQLL